LSIRGYIRFVLLSATLLGSAPIFSAPPTPPPLEAYGDLPGIEDAAISANGKGLLVAGNVGGNGRELLVFDEQQKLRVKIPLKDAKVRKLSWAGDDFALVKVSSTENLPVGYNVDKYEFYYTTVIPTTLDKTHVVFSRIDSIVDAVLGDYGARFVDGKWVGYYGGIELIRATGTRVGYEFDHGRPSLFAVDLANDTPKRMVKAPIEGVRNNYLIDANGSVGATMTFNGNGGRWSITNQQDTVLASGVDPTGNVGLVSFNHDGTSVIYAIEDKADPEVRWYQVPLAGGTPQEIFAGVKFEDCYFDPASGRLIGYLEQSAQPKIVMFDPARQAAVKKIYKAFAGREVSLRGWTTDFGKFLVRTSGNGDSGTWYMVDVAKLRASPVGDERPAITPQQVGPISTFAYKASDGLDLDGILTLPPGKEAKNLPVILLPHGGPTSHDEPEFDWWAQAFASRGYAVFQPNFRGSTNRDGAFRRAGYGQWGRKMQTDISDGLAALAKQGIVDPSRACIMGASYGGYAALAGVTLQNGLYRCAVAVAPVSDLGDMYKTDLRESPTYRKYVRATLNETLGDPRTFAEVSPRKKAAQADAPILMIHGKDDTVFSFHQSESMADALKNAGKPYELITLREEDHWLSRAATRKQMLEESMRFVLQHNPPN
jgi:dipeptidyl aminopeptidase/acylaminoacyl peptidase